MLVVVTVVVDVTIEYGYSIAYRLSNDGCNGSNGENECNGELDLSHFLNNEI